METFEQKDKTRGLLPSPSRATSYPPPTPKRKRKKNISPEEKKSVKWTDKFCRGTFLLKRKLLWPLFKLTSVDRRQEEFPPSSRSDNPHKEYREGNLRVWDHLAGAKGSFPRMKMAQIESPDFKKIGPNVCRKSPS